MSSINPLVFPIDDNIMITGIRMGKFQCVRSNIKHIDVHTCGSLILGSMGDPNSTFKVTYKNETRKYKRRYDYIKLMVNPPITREISFTISFKDGDGLPITNVPYWSLELEVFEETIPCCCNNYEFSDNSESE